VAAGSTYTPIATTTISGTSTVSTVFNSFSGYTDIVLVASVKSNRTSTDTMKITVNTSSSIYRTFLTGDGTSVTSNRLAVEPYVYLDNVPNNSSTSYVLGNFNFMNYGNTTTYKTVLIRGTMGDASTRATSSIISSTSAITSLTIGMASNSNLGNGSTFTLYGILAA